MASKPVYIVRKPHDWKNLYPAPKIAVEEKNCCDCIFAATHDIAQYKCKLTDNIMNSYDECGAFTKRKESEKPE